MSARETRRARQDRKRREAEERNAQTPHDRTKAHRLNRCDCGTPEARLVRAIFAAEAAS